MYNLFVIRSNDLTRSPITTATLLCTDETLARFERDYQEAKGLTEDGNIFHAAHYAQLWLEFLDRVLEEFLIKVSRLATMSTDKGSKCHLECNVSTTPKSGPARKYNRELMVQIKALETTAKSALDFVSRIYDQNFSNSAS